MQQQPVKKRALQGSGGSGRKAPGRSSGAGEIVEVEGGHIIRSMGRKDRHSKVCTAKGPRDRRVRLSANTAIQFYDVQDRLGYDRPSKAVDWLMKKAKSSIDELAHLPPWKPTAISNQKGKILSPEEADSAGDGFHYVGKNEEGGSSVLMPSMDSDSIADTINSSVQFQSYPVLNLQRRDSSQSQDLKLSLQSLQDPMLIQSNSNPEEEEQQSPFGYDNPNSVSGWDDSRFRHLIGWNFAGAGNSGGGGGGSGGFMFIPQAQQPLHQPILFGHGVGQAATHFLTQRGTLQSNNTPLVRACFNGENSGISTNHQDHRHHNQAVSVHPVSFPGIGYASSGGGFSSFHIPARIQGGHEEQQEDGNPNKPSSGASCSRR